MYTLVTKVLHNDLEIGACSLQSYTKQQGKLNKNYLWYKCRCQNIEKI